MQPLDKIHQRAQQSYARIVLPEGSDPRIVAGAVEAQKRGFCAPILLGDPTDIAALWHTAGGEADQLTVLDPAHLSDSNRYAQELYQLRQKKGMDLVGAQQAIQNPITLAALMVRLGDADGTVGGAQAPTADIVRAALQVIGRAPDVTTVSSFFLMLLCAPHHPKQGGLIFTDCGLIVAPSETELADIAIQSAASLENLLGQDPRIAMLSFSTHGSAKHAHVDHVVQATDLVKQRCPDLIIDGELQFDAAFVPEVCASKAQNSPLQGDANIMVFPNLSAANIGYKIAQRIGGATAIGPILQGLAKPANDLSRGCSTEDVVNLLAVTSVQAGMQHSS